MNCIYFIIELIKFNPETRQESLESPKNHIPGDLEVIPNRWSAYAGSLFSGKLTRLFLPTLFIFSSISAATFSQADLKKHAEIDGLGYKTANLIILKTLSEQINRTMPPYYVSVPAFVGISSSTIIEFIQTEGFNLAATWQKVITKSAGPNQRKKMLKKKQLNLKLRTELEKLQSQVKKIFSAQKVINFEPLKDFLHTAQQNNWSLMVRSTGKEDTEALANAGGNTSIANVPATEAHVMAAMGEVIASYLSIKSLQQRLQAGDESVFDAPFIPILIQRMIGEPLGGTFRTNDIPSGCVLYTTETDGFTPGVALAQATFGHNEGVVQSSMPIDTFYLCKNVTYASIKHKTKRLIPALENLQYTLTEKENPASLIDTPSLGSRAIRSLSIIAHTIENFYGKPMDLELVIMPHEQSIYLVQARPIVMPQGKETARYIKNLNEFKNSQLIPCTIINSNRCVLLEKLTSNQIILAQTLEKALEEFNNLDDAKEDILAIAVESQAEATSHAAAVFRGEGKVIVRIANDFKRLEDLMSQSEGKIAICTQQGFIIDLTPHQSLSKDQIAIGLHRHPINIPLSIIRNESMWPSIYLPHFSQSRKSAQEVLNEFKTSPNDEYLLDELLSIIKNQTLAPIHQVLKAATVELENQLTTKRKTLYQFVSLIIKEIKQAPNKEIRALHIRMLEQAINQHEEPHYVSTFSHESLQAYGLSISNFLNKVIEPALENNLVSKIFVQNPKILQIAQNGYNKSLTPTTQQIWLTFLDIHAQHALTEQHSKITHLLSELINNDLLAGWINTSLTQSMNKFSDDPSMHYKEISNTLVHEFESAQIQLEELKNILNSIMQIDPNQWENPKKFDDSFARFKKEVIESYTTPQFENLLQLCAKTPNNVLKLGVITALKKITDRYDLFIKAIKGSTQYPNKKLKIKHFHTMLEGYVALLEQLYDNQPLISALKDRLENYDEDDEAELVVSSHFNVNVVVQQSEDRIAFSRQKFFDYIESLEDLFTSTHQILLSEISKKIVAWEITKSIHTPTIISTLEAILELEDQLTGIRFEGNNVIFSYNRKLRAHSIQIEVCYDCENKKVTLSYHFYGFNEFLRWNLIKDYVAIISPKLKLNLEKIVSRDYGFSIYWNVPDTSTIEVLDDLLEDAIDITFELSIENRKTIFNNLEDTLETLFEKCTQLYGSSKELIKILTTTKLEDPFHMLTLSVLDDIALKNPAAAKILFRQGIKTVYQILETKSHDNLVTAHYILAEIVSAAKEIKSTNQKAIPLPKRIRLSNYKNYKRLITKLLHDVEKQIDRL